MFFFGITFDDARTDALFDLARLVLEPEYSRKAHITLRGPYKRRPHKNSKWFSHKVDDVTFLGPGHFFEGSQNTVFLKCEIPFISDIWRKPTYPNGVPHLTIYDGEDRRFAWYIFRTLQEHDWKFKTKPSKIKSLASKEKIETKYLVDGSPIERALSEIAARQYSMEKLKMLHEGQRIYLLKRICHHLHFLNCPSLTLI